MSDVFSHLQILKDIDLFVFTKTQLCDLARSFFSNDTDKLIKTIEVQLYGGDIKFEQPCNCSLNNDNK